MSRRLAILALVLAVLAPTAHARVIMSKSCETVWQGQPIRGVFQVDYDMYHDTHRVYGNFRDVQNNLIEFEILTNQPEGVGGMWFNNARHREVRIRWQMLPDGGFVITGENGAAARYACG